MIRTIRFSVCLAGLTLTGCAAAPVVPTEVKVPVPVSCIDAPMAKPAFSTDAELKALDDYHLAYGLWLDRRLRQLYELQLEAALAGCWQPGKDGT